MIRLCLPSNDVHRLPFYLAMEEWVAKRMPAGEYFFTWIVAPTVIIGRNQDLMSEVNMEYCRHHGIDVCRRRSGGGCVYADDSNIMISYVCPDTDVVSTFARYTANVVAQLRTMGIEAEASGRNDITVGGRKISGNAFYHLPGRSIVHGTMLYDTNVANMLNAITPSRAKLESKQVKSVEARITMAREHRPDLSFVDFHSQLTTGLETGRHILDEAEIDEIREIEKGYYRPEWLLYGESARSRLTTRRVEGVGCVGLRPVLDSCGLIDGIEMTGDVFSVRDFAELINMVKGLEPDAAVLALRLADVDVSEYVAGLTTERFIDLLLT